MVDNQATNQKAKESSKFGEHVKEEKEINAGKGTSANNIASFLKLGETKIINIA